MLPKTPVGQRGVVTPRADISPASSSDESNSGTGKAPPTARAVHLGVVASRVDVSSVGSVVVPPVVVGDNCTSFTDSNSDAGEAPPAAHDAHAGVVSSQVDMSLAGTTVVPPDGGGDTCTMLQIDLSAVPP